MFAESGDGIISYIALQLGSQELRLS